VELQVVVGRAVAEEAALAPAPAPVQDVLVPVLVEEDRFYLSLDTDDGD